MVAEGIPVSAGYRNAINYGLQFWRERKTFGTSSFPWGHDVGGRTIEWRDYDFPIVERIAQSLLLLEHPRMLDGARVGRHGRSVPQGRGRLPAVGHSALAALTWRAVGTHGRGV